MQLSTVDDCLFWAADLLRRLEITTPTEVPSIVWPAYRILYADRGLPIRICAWLDSERCNPPFDLDITSNPLQVVLARSRSWRLLMYVWLPQESGAPLNDTAHDHSSTGYSLIHQGGCYLEREYMRSPNGELILHQTYAPSPGQMRVIAPELLHAVDPASSGGFSFILWGPRLRTTTTVVDIQSSLVQTHESEYVDKLNNFLTAVRRSQLEHLIS